MQACRFYVTCIVTNVREAVEFAQLCANCLQVLHKVITNIYYFMVHWLFAQTRSYKYL